MKFGGSSMADAGQYRKVRDILMADPERKVIEAYDVWKEKKNFDTAHTSLRNCRSS